MIFGRHEAGVGNTPADGRIDAMPQASAGSRSEPPRAGPPRNRREVCRSTFKLRPDPNDDLSLYIIALPATRFRTLGHRRAAAAVQPTRVEESHPAICRRSRPAACRQANDIAAILPALTMRVAHAPRGFRKGRPHDPPPREFRSVDRPHGRSGARIARCRPRRPGGDAQPSEVSRASELARRIAPRALLGCGGIPQVPDCIR